MLQPDRVHAKVPFTCTIPRRARIRVPRPNCYTRRSVPTIWRIRFFLLFRLMLFLSLPIPGSASAVLSHETIGDAAWVTHIRPLLRQRFPNATPEELRRAHAYAYSGAIIQDMGYYPYGNKFFSDLAHYVRSGDFISALLRDSLRPERLRVRDWRDVTLRHRQ